MCTGQGPQQSGTETPEPMLVSAQEERGIAMMGGHDLRNLLLNRRRPAGPAQAPGRCTPGPLPSLGCSARLHARSFMVSITTSRGSKWDHLQPHKYHAMHACQSVTGGCSWLASQMWTALR